MVGETRPKVAAGRLTRWAAGGVVAALALACTGTPRATPPPPVVTSPRVDDEDDDDGGGAVPSEGGARPGDGGLAGLPVEALDLPACSPVALGAPLAPGAPPLRGLAAAGDRWVARESLDGTFVTVDGLVVASQRLPSASRVLAAARGPRAVALGVRGAALALFEVDATGRPGVETAVASGGGAVADVALAMAGSGVALAAWARDGVFEARALAPGAVANVVRLGASRWLLEPRVRAVGTPEGFVVALGYDDADGTSHVAVLGVDGAGNAGEPVEVLTLAREHLHLEALVADRSGLLLVGTQEGARVVLVPLTLAGTVRGSLRLLAAGVRLRDVARRGEVVTLGLAEGTPNGDLLRTVDVDVAGGVVEPGVCLSGPVPAGFDATLAVVERPDPGDAGLALVYRAPAGALHRVER